MAQPPFPHAKVLKCVVPNTIVAQPIVACTKDGDYFLNCLCNYSTEKEICIQKPYVVPETCEELGMMLEARYNAQNRDKASDLDKLSSKTCEWNEDQTKARSKDDSADDSTAEPRFKADDLYCELN